MTSVKEDVKLSFTCVIPVSVVWASLHKVLEKTASRSWDDLGVTVLHIFMMQIFPFIARMLILMAK